MTATDACRRDIARDLLADLRRLDRLDRQVKDNEAEMREALAVTRHRLRPCRAWAPCWQPRSSGTSATSAASPPSTTSPATQAAHPWTPPAATMSANGATPAEPRAEFGPAHHRRLPDLRQRARAGALPVQERGRGDARGGPQSSETTAVQRRLPNHETRPRHHVAEAALHLDPSCGLRARIRSRTAGRRWSGRPGGASC